MSNRVEEHKKPRVSHRQPIPDSRLARNGLVGHTVSTNREPRVGAEMFAEWCKASEDGYDYKAGASRDGVVISGEREVTHRLVNANGEVESEHTEKQQLRPLLIARMHNKEADVHVVEPLASERETENLCRLFLKSKSDDKPLRYFINAYGSLKYLPLFQKRCPWVTVYNFDDLGHLCGDFESQGVFPHRDLEAAANSRELFHTYDELVELPDPQFIIEGFAEQYDKIIIGGLSGHGKTLLLLDVVRSLLNCTPLFDYFDVPDRTCWRSTEVKSASLGDRFVIALCSPEYIGETGLPMWGPEKSWDTDAA
jgi:hypothetical protein